VQHSWYRLATSCVVDWFKRKVLWIIQCIKDYIREKIQDWLIDQFLDKTRTTKLVANMVLTLASLDVIGIIKIILSNYGMGYLIKYIVLVSMLWDQVVNIKLLIKKLIT
jgi:Na+/serine symporter